MGYLPSPLLTKEGYKSQILSLPPFDRFSPQFVIANKHRTAYIRHGQGPPVVLLHGYAGAIWNWEHQIEALGRRFTLFIPDLIGQGF